MQRAGFYERTGRRCGGCNTEDEPIAICAACGQAVFEGEEVFDIDGYMLHYICIAEYFKEYIVYAERKG